MQLHESTYHLLNPTEDQKEDMDEVRTLFEVFTTELLSRLPDGPDTTYVVRMLRTAAMWSNAAIMREPDGEPRE